MQDQGSKIEIRVKANFLKYDNGYNPFYSTVISLHYEFFFTQLKTCDPCCMVCFSWQCDVDHIQNYLGLPVCNSFKGTASFSFFGTQFQLICYWYGCHNKEENNCLILWLELILLYQWYGTLLDPKYMMIRFFKLT